MSVSRRDFLKGMAAVSVFPVVGLQAPVSKTDNFPDISKYPRQAGLFSVYCHVRGMRIRVWVEGLRYDPETGKTVQKMENCLAMLGFTDDSVLGYGNDVTPYGRCVAFPVFYGDKVIVTEYGRFGTKEQVVYEGGPMEMYVGTDGPYPNRGNE